LVTVGEIISRRRLKSQSDDFYEPGQHKAVAVEDKAVLSWVDGVGVLIIMACHRVGGQDNIEEWVLVKPAHVIMIGRNGAIQTRPFATSYRFDEKQTRRRRQCSQGGDEQEVEVKG
jgi:hypothetical protein